MSKTSDQRSEEFLKISAQFKLGALITESSHPVTANLSDVAQRDIVKALDQLFQVDSDVLAKYREFVVSGRAGGIKEAILDSLRRGGRIFFTGCGSTGRLSIQLVSIWRDFWQQRRARGLADPAATEDFENRAFSVMAGGDYALIKSVEGFEDFAEFGKKQLGDLGVSGRDVVFAITEGGETSFVIGTAWKGVDAGAKVYFVYNNPDDLLCREVERSREVIEDPRIEKINLTTGPMAITGSTRMQATTIQLCVLMTILEMVVHELIETLNPGTEPDLDSSEIESRFERGLDGLLRSLRSPDFLAQLASWVELETETYRAGGRNNYFADQFALDVLTDTTERSPTYCTPPFRKFDDTTATDSWSFLFTPEPTTPGAWERLLKRPPRCIGWTDDEARALVGEDKLERTREILRRIRHEELLRFRIGQDGLAQRPFRAGDSAVAIVAGDEAAMVTEPGGIAHSWFQSARELGARRAIVWVGGAQAGQEFAVRNPDCLLVFLPPGLPDPFLLRGIQRVGLKLMLNALSTCTMVRLGRVMGNYMVWVVPSNLKLIDRSTRYLQRLADLSYEAANRLLFEVIEHVEPRMKSDQAYPPVVGLAVIRARNKLTNEAAEQRFLTETGQSAGIRQPRQGP